MNLAYLQKLPVSLPSIIAWCGISFMGTPMCKPAHPDEIPEYSSGVRTAAAPIQQQRRISDVIIPPLNARQSNAVSSRIDRDIAKQKKDEIGKLKMLLLGGADAGKSTILKQMRILHMNGFQDAEELLSFAKYMRYNLFQVYMEVANGILLTYPQVSEFEVDLVEKFSNGIQWILTISVEQELIELRNFSQLECVNLFLRENPNWPSLPDNHAYILPNLERVLSVSYSPTHEDILNLRIPTHHINEINFEFSTCTIRLIDVGGQRTYRKKWIHCFEGCAAVLFVASMAAYDQAVEDVDPSPKPVLYSQLFNQPPEQKITNRLRDSAHLFGEMMRNTFLRTAAFILFLNKKDLFQRKLATSKIKQWIHAYEGDNSMDDASDFIKEYFLKRKSKRDRDRKIYSHYTCATDTQNVQFVFKAACDIVLQKNLNSSGIQ